MQSVYCGAKFAIRGFLDALRSELYHDKLDITVTEVDLPAINTPQFDWARNKMGRKAQPVPPIFQPEVAARAIYFGAFNPRRQIWVGFPTVKAIIANRIAPGLLDRYLAKSGYTGQLTDEPADADAPGNLFAPVAGDYSAHGRFDERARTESFGDARKPQPHARDDGLCDRDRPRRSLAGEETQDLIARPEALPFEQRGDRIR